MDDIKKEVNQGDATASVAAQHKDTRKKTSGKKVDDMDGLLAKITGLENELEECKGAKLRLAADCENIKSRSLKEKQEYMAFSQNMLLAKLLEFMNDFRTIIESDYYKSNSSDPWLNGVGALYSKLQSIIKSEGVELLDIKKDDMFDPKWAQAIGFINIDDIDRSNRIESVVSVGYKRKDNGILILPARVIVTKKI